jgi:WD40 repeat protein
MGDQWRLVKPLVLDFLHRKEQHVTVSDETEGNEFGGADQDRSERTGEGLEGLADRPTLLPSQISPAELLGLADALTECALWEDTEENERDRVGTAHGDPETHLRAVLSTVQAIRVRGDTRGVSALVLLCLLPRLETLELDDCGGFDPLPAPELRSRGANLAAAWADMARQQRHSPAVAERAQVGLSGRLRTVRILAGPSSLDGLWPLRGVPTSVFQHVSEACFSLTRVRLLRASQLRFAAASLTTLDLRGTRLLSLFDLGHALATSAPHLVELWLQSACEFAIDPSWIASATPELSATATAAGALEPRRVLESRVKLPNIPDSVVAEYCFQDFDGLHPYCDCFRENHAQNEFHFDQASWLCFANSYRLFFEYLLGMRKNRKDIWLDGIRLRDDAPRPADPQNDQIFCRVDVERHARKKFDLPRDEDRTRTGCSIPKRYLHARRSDIAVSAAATGLPALHRTEMRIASDLTKMHACAPYSYRLLFPRGQEADQRNRRFDFFLPRQFEHHPLVPGRIAFGMMDGVVCVVNTHTNGELARSAPQGRGGGHSVLGLSWLRTANNTDRFLCGTEDGVLHAYQLRDGGGAGSDNDDDDGDDDASNAPFSLGRTSHARTYDRFPNLTCVNSNCDDSVVLLSGHHAELNMRLYDIATGKVVRDYRNAHSDAANVAKFAQTTPFVFASCSFDSTVKVWDIREDGKECVSSFRHDGTYGSACQHVYCFSRGLSVYFVRLMFWVFFCADVVFIPLHCAEPVTVCVWSPDDRYLLASSVDNDVRQYSTRDGLRSIHTHIPSDPPLEQPAIFKSGYMPAPIAPLGNDDNYTRAYYLDNGRRIAIGSCASSVVSVYSSETGALSRTVDLAEIFMSRARPGARPARPFVQSLRGDEFEPMSFTALLYSGANAEDMGPLDDIAVLASVQLYPGAGQGDGPDPIAI